MFGCNFQHMLLYPNKIKVIELEVVCRVATRWGTEMVKKILQGFEINSFQNFRQGIFQTSLLPSYFGHHFQSIIKPFILTKQYDNYLSNI